MVTASSFLLLNVVFYIIPFFDTLFPRFVCALQTFHPFDVLSEKLMTINRTFCSSILIAFMLVHHRARNFKTPRQPAFNAFKVQKKKG